MICFCACSHQLSLNIFIQLQQSKLNFFICACFPLRSDNKVTVHFINRDGEKITVKGSPGDSLLDVVINEDLDIDGFGI